MTIGASLLGHSACVYVGIGVALGRDNPQRRQRSPSREVVDIVLKAAWGTTDTAEVQFKLISKSCKE